MFFVLSKIMSPFLAVENWFVIGLLIVVVLMARQKWRASRILTTVLLIGAIIIGFFPIGDALLRPLETQYSKPDKLEEVSGIILLGGPELRNLTNEWGEPQFGDGVERVTETMRLARAYPDAKIIVTSGVATLRGQNDDGLRGGEILAKTLMEQGIAPERLIVEQQARNTADNAQLAKLALGDEASGNWILVTSAFHMQRAKRSFENADWTGLVAWPTDYRSLPFWQNVRWDLLKHIQTLDIAIHEYIGILAYRITSH